MQSLRPYNLTILIHPQAETQEKNEIETLVSTWLSERGGKVNEVKKEEKRRVSYDIGHTQQVSSMNMQFDFSGEKLIELTGKLGRQKKILRFRLFQTKPRGTQKTLKDLPSRKPETSDLKQDSSRTVKKGLVTEKATMENLDEKIEKVLTEEVL